MWALPGSGIPAAAGPWSGPLPNRNRAVEKTTAPAVRGGRLFALKGVPAPASRWSGGSTRRPSFFTRPNPPRRRFSGKRATVISALPSRSGGISRFSSTAESPKSASTRARKGARAKRAPKRTAAPLPRLRSSRKTSAPAAAASAAVSSVEPSSTTRTRLTCGSFLKAAIVRPMYPDSLYAGMSTSISIAVITYFRRKQPLAAAAKAVVPAGPAGKHFQQGHLPPKSIDIVHQVWLRAHPGQRQG